MALNIPEFPGSDVQKSANKTKVVSSFSRHRSLGPWTKEILIVYAIITSEIIPSNLNVVTSFGHVIFAITTKARAAEGSLSQATRRW
jgi:hypothetical protein